MTEPQPLSVIVCRAYGFKFRTVAKCPVEGKLRRMVGLHEIWHGLSHTCLGCGNSWQDSFSYRMRAPLYPRFDPKWRDKAKQKARQDWKTSQRLYGPEHRAWEEAEMRDILGADDETTGGDDAEEE